MGDEGEGGQAEEDRDVSRLLLSIMEGYSDSVIPSFSQLSPIRHETPIKEERGSSSRKRSRREEEEEEEETAIRGSKRAEAEDYQGSQREKKERDRREKMSDMFTKLQSSVPNVARFHKATREKIIGETIQHIKALEREKETLEELKKSLEAGGRVSQRTNWKSSVSVVVSGDLMLFEIHSWVRRRRLVMNIFMVFEKYQAEILAANVAVNDGQLILSVTAIVNGGESTVEMIKEDILIL